MARKIILVTGGAGFIGSHLCARLTAEGHRVISLDNYFTGSKENHIAGVEYREGHTKDIERHVPEIPDLIYHLGEYSRVEKSFEDPLELVWDLNKTGTFAVLEFWRKRKSKLVYAGSSTKFSDGGLGRDQSPYAWTKASNTELVKNYSTWFGLTYAITYFYNVYGPGEMSFGPYATLIGIFTGEFKKGEPLTIVAPGTQTRNFTHVDDIVEGLVLVGERGEGDDFGIGNDTAFSILDVAQMLGGETVMLAERKGNRLNSAVDNSKIRSLGWLPRVSLPEYLKILVSQERETISAEKRIIVFAPTFYPVEGPAEKALVSLMQKMPDIQFDVITTTYSKEAKNSPPPFPNVRVFRVGTGNPFDKYLLPILGAKKAKELCKQETYLFAWALMASYGALAALFLRRSTNLPLLITLADQDISAMPWYSRFILKRILKDADQLSTTTTEQDRNISGIRRGITATSRGGDAFANALRFMYTDIFRKGV
jgi:UDP-glucose 4-epimerase